MAERLLPTNRPSAYHAVFVELARHAHDGVRVETRQLAIAIKVELGDFTQPLKLTQSRVRREINCLNKHTFNMLGYKAVGKRGHGYTLIRNEDEILHK